MSKRWLFAVAAARARAWRFTRSTWKNILPVMMVAATFPLLWDAVTGEGQIVSYRIYKANAETGAYTLLKTVTSTNTRVEVPIDETRCYRVKAVDELGQVSPYSDYLCITVSTKKGL